MILSAVDRTVKDIPDINFVLFSKVEQFVICSPHDDESWKLMDEMIGNAESFCQMLNIPYRWKEIDVLNAFPDVSSVVINVKWRLCNLSTALVDPLRQCSWCLHSSQIISFGGALYPNPREWVGAITHPDKESLLVEIKSNQK